VIGNCSKGRRAEEYAGFFNERGGGGRGLENKKSLSCLKIRFEK